MGGPSWGYLEDIEGSWPETWRTGSFFTSWMMFFTQRKIPWKFCVDISIRSVSRMGVNKSCTWRTLRVPDQRHGGLGHSWCHEWCFLPQGRYPENFVLISLLEVCQEGAGSRRGVPGGHWGFLIRDMVDRVIPGIMTDILLPDGRYPENFLLIFQL